ncbi:hypothetical protein HU200_027101 [Digitaria exilis]|uniref:Hydrophobic seed protein domain-containing protein n=1 Tax=Digitaria exilis TaxID=1010633 RepID=A0A835C847_9POAL|nr:hypothetical protein HU200_027101 [Digitaria exilis]
MAPSSKVLAVLLVALATLTLAAAQTPPPPPPPPATPPSSGNGTCEPLRLRVCSSLLSGLLGGILGGNATSDAQCCSLLGIAGVDAGVCLCTALRANVLGTLNLNVPLALRLVLSLCGTPAPAGFTCPPA